MAGFIGASDVGGWFGGGASSGASSGSGSSGASIMAVSAITSSVSSIMAGRAAKAVAKYNRSLYNIQAGIIEANNEWKKKQYAELRPAVMGKGISTLQGQNVGLTGRTSLSLLNKSMTNLYLDEAISDYNARMSASQARSGANIAYQQGSAVATANYVQAGNTAAKGIFDYAMYQQQGK